MGALFVHPVFAGSLGVLFGIVLVLISRAASKLMTPEDPTLGLAKVSLIAFLRMFVVLGAMMLYFTFAREGFLAFSVSLVVMFVLSLAYEAFRASHTLSSQ
jgi:membrane associated rhomboid family serine protease